MRAVDTNVLVRLIARDDARQTAAAESFVEKGAWVSILALAEAIWVLGTVYELTTKEQARVIEMLLNHRALVLQDAATVTAALELFRAKPALGFSGCLMLQMARRAGQIPLGTFDRNLARVAGTEKLRL
jgi:predicted nucleic-acid-binding protein